MQGPSEQERKKSALLTAAAVMMYILSPVMIILFESIGLEILGLVLFFGCIAGATGMLIYNHMTRPVYEKQDEKYRRGFSRSGARRPITRKSVPGVSQRILVSGRRSLFSL